MSLCPFECYQSAIFRALAHTLFRFAREPEKGNNFCRSLAMGYCSASPTPHITHLRSAPSAASLELDSLIPDFSRLQCDGRLPNARKVYK